MFFSGWENPGNSTLIQETPGVRYNCHVKFFIFNSMILDQRTFPSNVGRFQGEKAALIKEP